MSESVHQQLSEWEKTPHRMKVLLLVVIASYVLLCPYTKVEESFNMQAMHDMLEYMQGNLLFSEFDHFQFPGVVPRTCIGALMISFLSLPIVLIIKFIVSMINLTNANNLVFHKSNVQLIVRMVLGVISWHSLCYYSDMISKRFNSKRAGDILLLLIAASFHVPFYASRSLPNMFAFILATYGWGFWLDGKPYAMLGVLTTATVIFRCDILVILGPLVVQLLLQKETLFFRTIRVGIITGLVSLVVTVAVDSIFWDKVVWPEGVVLFFNTVQNKSGEWGIMPWHWYFSNALLRSLTFSIIFMIVGLMGITNPCYSTKKPVSISFSSYIANFFHYPDKTIVYYTAPALLFIGLYSILPHKELRFILPAVPLLLLPATIGIHRILPQKSEYNWYPFNQYDNMDLEQTNIPANEGTRSTDSTGDVANTSTSLRNRRPSATAQTVNGNNTGGSDNGDAGYDYRNDEYFMVRFMNFTINYGLRAILLLMIAATSVFAIASYHNYPGGMAISRLLHQHIPLHYATEKVNVINIHMDTAACMTGITRFLQEDTYNQSIKFDKNESLTIGHGVSDPYIFNKYDFLITEDVVSYGKINEFEIIDTIQIFESFTLSPSVIPCEINTKDALYLLKKRKK